MRMRQTAILQPSLLAVLLALSACSSGKPVPARMGTPEWYWNMANDRFAAGDLAKTQESLEKVVLSNSPLKPKAASWYLVLLAGMALGDKELAAAYEEGSKLTKTQAAEFRRFQNDARRLSKQFALALAEQLEQFQKETAGASEISLDFSYPAEVPAEDPGIARIKRGILPPEEERVRAERMTVKRGVLREAASVVGAGDDTSKAASMFQSKPVKVPRNVFFYGLAEGLLEQSKLFDRKQLNEPDKKKIMLQMASTCLKAALEGDDAELKKKAKGLQEKISKEEKALKA
jgi:hypothetical protein